MLQHIDPQYPPDDVDYTLFANYQPNVDDPGRQKPPKEPKIYSKNHPPKTNQEPTQKEKDAGRILEAKARGLQLGKLFSRKTKPVLPGWLIELDDAKLSACMEIKDNLGLVNDLEELTEALHRIISESLGVPGVSESMILEVVRRIPDTGFGLSFPHFMFAMGNISLAEQKRMLNPNVRPYNGKKYGGSSSSKEGKTRKTKPENETDMSGYSLQEQVFYSGLLIFEMYETIARVQAIYNGSVIPETPEQRIKTNEKFGFGPNDIGSKKRGVAEWDRPLPPLPKLSPYLAPMPFVTTRWKVVKPSVNDKGRRRTLTSSRPIHMMIKPPQNVEGKIRVMENKTRLRQAMVYLASQGDVVAMLPNSHFLINISDTFIQKMEEYHYLIPQHNDRLYFNNQLAWIERNAKELYRPHGVPPQVTKMPHMIRYTDGLKLRDICKRIRLQHWDFICQKQALFREQCWKRMHVGRIPYGRLRDSFVYSFITYLPYKAYLPIVHDKSNLPY